VLVETTEMESPLGPFAHLGVACASREGLDALCDEARHEGCLRDEPNEMGGPAGYLAALSDPDGHRWELWYRTGEYDTLADTAAGESECCQTACC
jgi:hypothetical protein